MKILIKDKNIEKINLCKAFNQLDIRSALWGGPTSAFDVFDRFDPTVFICDIDQINTDILKCLRQRPYLKTIIKVSENLKIDHLSEINCFFYTSNSDTESMSSFKNIKQIFNSAYPFALNVTDKIFSDICFFGDYGNPILNKTLVKLCSDFKYNIKIFGNNWHIAQNCGYIDDIQKERVLAGAKINLHIDLSNEIPTRIYQNYFNKFFTLTVPLSIESENFKTVKDFFDKIENLINSDLSEKIEYYYNIGKNNTTFHRIGQMLDLIGENNCQEKIASIISRF